MSAPTVGSIVWYTPAEARNLPGKAEPPDTEIPGPAPGEALAAIVAHVVSDALVNLAVFDAHGVAHARQGVRIWDGKDDAPIGGYASASAPQKKQPQKGAAEAKGGFLGLGREPARVEAPD